MGILTENQRQIITGDLSRSSGKSIQQDGIEIGVVLICYWMLDFRLLLGYD